MSRREKNKVKNNWILKIIVVAIFLAIVIFAIKIAGNYKNNASDGCTAKRMGSEIPL